MSQHTRRDLMKVAGVAAMVQAGRARSQGSPEVPPAGEIAVRLTAGAKRFAPEPARRWRPADGPAGDAIVLDSGTSFQEILGFGASFTDASCYTFHQLPPVARQQLFHELFHPSEMGLNVCRICIGSSDYATQAYSYDEGEPDPDLQRFSIDHDRGYILPMLKLGRNVNPEIFLLASPWSPPGWMKANRSLLGGSMRSKYFPSYARYFGKFLQSYSEAGVKVDAVTVQNEVDTDQDGRMPACLWGQEYETGFIAGHLGPLLEREKIDTRIWILDHNYNLWGRAICELDDPAVNRYVDGVAWHGYVGRDSDMTRVHNAHPEKHMYWSEGGPDFRDPRYQTDWSRWGASFAGILRNWARCVIGWNLALDEAGKPNIGPFDCGGLVTIHSKSGEIARSGQYWAFAHYSRAIRRGARRMESTGGSGGVAHVAFTNPDGGRVAVLTNPGEARQERLRMTGAEVDVDLPADSIVTLSWRS